VAVVHQLTGSTPNLPLVSVGFGLLQVLVRDHGPDDRRVPRRLRDRRRGRENHESVRRHGVRREHLGADRPARLHRARQLDDQRPQPLHGRPRDLQHLHSPGPFLGHADRERGRRRPVPVIATILALRARASALAKASAPVDVTVDAAELDHRLATQSELA
jgi:hypothetical protein